MKVHKVVKYNDIVTVSPDDDRLIRVALPPVDGKHGWDATYCRKLGEALIAAADDVEPIAEETKK